MPSTDEEILAEHREIRKLLTPAPKPEPPKGLMNEFRSFIKQYNVLGMAVAFIFGIYLGALTKALVTDLLLPLISFFLPGQNINTVTLGPFGIGDFANSLLTFLIVAFVIFLIVKAASRYNLG
jgi:large conductance mechanosensitive channel